MSQESTKKWCDLLAPILTKKRRKIIFPSICLIQGRFHSVPFYFYFSVKWEKVGDGDERAFFSISQSRTLKKIIPNPSFPRGADRDFEKNKSTPSHAASVWETRAGGGRCLSSKKRWERSTWSKMGTKADFGKKLFPPLNLSMSREINLSQSW